MAAKTPLAGEALRTVVNLKLRLPVRTVDEFVSRYGEDVSRTGMRVRTSGSCPVGANVKLDLQFQDGSPLLSGDATVSWSRPPDGVGVKFDKLTPASEIMVEKILQLQLDKSPAPRGPKLVGVDVDSGELLSQAGPEEATPAVAMELPAEARRGVQEDLTTSRSSGTPSPVFTGGKAIEGKRRGQNEARVTPVSGVSALPETTPAPVMPEPSAQVAIHEGRPTPPRPAASAAFMKAPVAQSAASPPKKNGKLLVMAALAVAGIGGVVAVVARGGGSKSAPDAPAAVTAPARTAPVAVTPPPPAEAPRAEAPPATPPAAAAVAVAEAPAAPPVVETHAASAPERRERERDNDRRHPPAKNARGNARESSREPAQVASADKTSATKAPDVAPPSVAPPAPPVVAEARRPPADSKPAAEAHAAPAASSTEPSPVAGGLSHRLGLTSIPSQAEVLIDGQSVGRTPLFGTQIDNSRSHVVTFRKEGYLPFEEKISPTSAWTIKVSDRSTAILRISALLKRAP